MARRLVDDDPHGALGGVGTEIDHGASEALILHRRRRDQDLAVEKPAFFTTHVRTIRDDLRMVDHPLVFVKAKSAPGDHGSGNFMS